MFRISKITGIISSILILVVSIICAALHFEESIFQAILYLGIIGSLLLLVSALSAESMNKFIFICLVIGLLIITVVVILIFIRLRLDEKYVVVLPLVVAAEFLGFISATFGGVAYFVVYRRD